jgi:hypothetical protein
MIYVSDGFFKPLSHVVIKIRQTESESKELIEFSVALSYRDSSTFPRSLGAVTCVWTGRHENDKTNWSILWKHNNDEFFV